MEEIVIPPTVKKIHDIAFKGCTVLKRVKFCDEIEEFVSHKAMQVWWNQGVHVRCLSTYCFLVQCSIPARFLGLTPLKSWQANIYDMLRSIPTISAVDSYNNDEDADEDTDEDTDDDGDEDENEEDLIYEDKDESLTAHFDAIDARLAVYENLREAPKLLGLIIQIDDIVDRVLSFF